MCISLARTSALVLCKRPMADVQMSYPKCNSCPPKHLWEDSTAMHIPLSWGQIETEGGQPAHSQVFPAFCIPSIAHFSRHCFNPWQQCWDYRLRFNTIDSTDSQGNTNQKSLKITLQLHAGQLKIYGSTLESKHH